MRPLLPLLAFTLLATAPEAQLSEPGPKHEFRGAWVATVGNLDWPSRPGLSTAQQQAQLVAILDGLKTSGVNAVLFQVRTEADAMYDSALEPWSYWLTGAQGAPPDPFYDPLAFAVEEAHARGMELHAWLNPYRADRGSSYPNSADHVTREHPEWMLLFTRTGSRIQIFDPGLQESRDRVAEVVADIVRRYDVDGIHFDDYFYPYPPNQIGPQDANTFATHSRGFTDLGDWRRDNVNLMVAQVQDSVNALDPSVKFGISPFGIWKNGTPSGTSGLDAYGVIYADAVAWLDAQTIDYVTPQLYWSSQRAFDTNGDGTPDQFNQQRFTTLAPWWESVRNTRHLYPGLGAYRTGSVGYSAQEIPRQVRYTRTQPGIEGTVMFRVYDGILSAGLGLADSLAGDLYRHPALTPTMDWKSQDAPADPGPLASAWSGDRLTLTWEAGTGSDAEARRFAVYRVPGGAPADLGAALSDPTNLLAITGGTTLTDRPTEGSEWSYAVTAVSTNSIESGPTNVVTVTGRAVSAEAGPLAPEAALLAPRPNPTRGAVQASFSLDRSARVTLRVVDVLGREVAVLLRDAPHAAGLHAAAWDGRAASGAAAPSGTYVLILDAEGARETRPVTVVR